MPTQTSELKWFLGMHGSEQYNCSSEELDTLVAISKGAGALGSRLTGAGWGGCTVSLVHNRDVEGFITQVGRLFITSLAHVLPYMCTCSG